MSRQKVFGIGFHKTGTTTLSRALRILDYRVAGPFGVHDEDIAETAVSRAIASAAEYDAVQDNPWPLVYRELDEAYPGSKFILTVRDTERWLASVVNHFGGKSTPMRRWIYGPGDPAENQDIYRSRYDGHNSDVVEYFRDRPGDLLTLRIADGEGWPELCGFLGVAIPDEPFPHANARQERSLFRVLSRRVRRLFKGRQ